MSESQESFFIVGLSDEEGEGWELIGLFDDRSKAVAACTTWRHFYGPTPPVNVSLPDETSEWPDLHYPLAERS